MQVVLNIIFTFCIYGIIAFSFSIIYNATRAFYINHAIIISFGAYFCFWFKNSFNLIVYVSIPLAIFCSVLMGAISELIIFRPMRKKNAPAFTFLVASIGLYGILQNGISLYFGDATKTLNTSDILIGHAFFNAHISTVQLITIAVSFVLFVAIYFLHAYTNLGKQIRAVSENLELSHIYGIQSSKIILICVCIGSVYAAIAGILSAYDTNLSPTMGFNLLLFGIVVMIIGGVGSFRGILLGSLLLAISQNLVAYYLDTKWMDASTYIILITFLLWKPLGFSGKRLKKVVI